MDFKFHSILVLVLFLLDRIEAGKKIKKEVKNGRVLKATRKDRDDCVLLHNRIRKKVSNMLFTQLNKKLVSIK